MKKIFVWILLTFAFSLSLCSFAFADASIDKSKIENGLVAIKYTGDLSKPVKIQVEKDTLKYTYSIKNNNPNYVPLQMGTGSYKVTIFENVSGTKYKSLVSESISVDKINILEMYKASIFIIDFSTGPKALTYYTKLAGKSEGKEKVDLVYNDVTDNYSYDFDKAGNIQNQADYVPVIDTIFASKKGICYDYAVLMAASLRSQGIPTKLQMGYSPDIKEYHAWNEIYINDKWSVVDTTYDAQVKKAGMTPVFAKDGSKYKVMKTY